MSPTPRARRGLLWAAGAVAVALLAGRVAASLYVDHAWYASVGALAVWREELVDELILRGGLFVIGTLLVLANVYAVRSSVVSLVLPRRVANLEIGEQVAARTLTAAAVALSVALGALLAAAYDGWTSLALARAAVPFGERDPYFDVDIRFFVAWLPLESALYVWSLLAVALATAVTVFLYALTPSLRWERGGLRVSAYVRRHFVSLGALFCLILAWSYRLDAYATVISDGRTSFGWIDHHFTIPASIVLAVAAIGTGLTVLVAGWRGRMRLAFVALSIMLGLAITARQLVPFVLRQMEGAGTANDQAPYDAARAAYTRRAFGANDVLVDDSTLVFDASSASMATPSLWDAPMLVRAVTRGRTARVAGGPVPTRPAGAMLLATGPADETEAASGAGWAAARRSSGSVDARGAPLPVDGAGATAAEDQPLRPVRIWDARLPTLTIGDRDDDGGAPITAPMQGWLQRLAYSWSEQDLGLLRDDPARGDRVMLRRSLRERVGAIVPYLKQGGSIAPAVVGDTLYWIVPLYIASSYYPLSDAIAVRTDRWTYVRHAATALVQSSSGRVTVLADSQPDAVMRAWIARFPSSFARWADVSPDLRAQLPPASDAALGQAFAYARYGSRSAPTTGRRAIDPDAGSGGLEEGHDLLDLAGTSAWPIPIVDAADEVTGVLVAVGGPQPRTAYVAARAPLVRWSTLADRLNRADDREARTSTDSAGAGARMLLGRVRAVPLRGGRLAFVRTAYRLRADGAPVVSHLSIAADDSVWTVRALAAEAPPLVAGVTSAVDLKLGAAALYDSTRAALRRGDWAAFGAAYDALGRALARPRR